MKRPNGSQRTSEHRSSSALAIPLDAADAPIVSTTDDAGPYPLTSRLSFCRRRGILLATIATIAVALGSSLPVFAFVPQTQKKLASSSSGSRLPSSASYAADQPDNSTANGIASSALKASTFAPPAAGRSATNDDDDDDQREDETTAAARTLLASKTEQVATLRAAQAEQLERISELTSNLANVHGDTDKLYTDLVKSQADLVKGLDEVTKLISEVSDATGTLTEMEVQRMEAMAALENMVGSAVAEEAVAEEGEEDEEVIVNSSAAVQVRVSKIYHMLFRLTQCFTFIYWIRPDLTLLLSSNHAQ